MHDLLQVRREQLEVVGLLGFDPIHLGPRGRFRETRDQGRRRRDCVIALPAHLAQVRERPILELRRGGLGTLEQPCDPRCRQQRVVLGFERGELLTAHVGTAARHHDGRIPAQQRESASKRVQSPEFLFELLIGWQAHGIVTFVVKRRFYQRSDKPLVFSRLRAMRTLRSDGTAASAGKADRGSRPRSRRNRFGRYDHRAASKAATARAPCSP